MIDCSSFCIYEKIELGGQGKLMHEIHVNQMGYCGTLFGPLSLDSKAEYFPSSKMNQL